MVVASTRPAEDGLRDFRAVYRAHYGFVWHALHRFGVAPAVVDDAVQDVFVVAYRRRETYRGPTPKPWLYGIARRVASNYRRSFQRRAQRDQALPRAPRPPVADGTREIIEGLERYLAGLRSEDRELFVLSEIEGMTGPELASATGRNVQTIYTRVRKLKVELGEHVGGFERVRRERPQATARSWALLLPVLRESSQAAVTTAAATGWGVTGWSWVVGAVGVASLAIVAAVLPARERPEPAASSSETPATAAARAHAPGAPGAPAQPTETTPEPRVEAPVPSPVPSPSPSPAAPAAAVEPSRDAARTTSPAASTDASTPAPSPSDGLGVETELLRRASTELAAGNASAALRTTIDHARRFPHSVLADLRTAVRIEALCELGKTEQARGEAKLFLRERPGSPVAERIERACTPAS